MKNDRYTRLVGISWLCACAWMPGAASAQEVAAGTLDEIIVTANKRDERISDVPISITAATGDQLAKQGITSAEMLEKVVPGFTFLKSNLGVPVFTLRGIGFIDTSLGASPTVSVYLDQVSLPFSAMTEGTSLDLERVEVLKGPQGTLFGQNSTGGAINYIAAKPTDQPSAGASLTYGRFNEADAEAFVSGPLVSTLTARAAVRTEHSDAWQQSYTRDATIGKRDFTTGRLLLDWKPADVLRFELNVNGWLDNSQSQANQFNGYSPTVPNGYPNTVAALSNYPIAPRNDRAADWDPSTSFERDNRFYQLSLHADWDIFENLTLTSISAYSELREHMPTDADGTDFNDITAIVDGTLSSASEELRLAGQPIERLHWVLGGNVQQDHANEDQIDLLGSTNNGVGPFRYGDVLESNHQSINTKAAFGNIDFKLTDTFSVQDAVRYTKQDRDFKGCLRDTGDGELATAFSALYSAVYGPTVIPPGGCVTLDADNKPAVALSELNQSNVSWKSGLSWKPDSDTLLYANATKGFKSGGYSTIPGINSEQYKPVTQEDVLAYETGFKAAFLSHTLEVDSAAFYYRYTNKQIQGYVNTGPPFGNLPTLVNIPKSSVRGAEVDANWSPIKGLKITAGATYVGSRVDGDFMTNDQAGTIVDVKGDQFPNAPKWQFVSDGEYEFPLTDAWSGFVGASVTDRTTSYSFLGDNPHFEIAGYALLDLRAGAVSPSGKWRVQLWGHNVTDRYYLTNAAHPIDTFIRTTGMPATFGVTGSYRWN